ncbi:QueT transporter family protein [Vagococcus sp. BWB3-3]|uniref:QueT transporter family protein n=1 Tax=Vagococcus allomyrinae TaxID=2794353 RepID=A0A940SV03_9ENTE|nr:QueT transporter family protein [Vagococcus allomyrinae]MBP1039853.1 QueT transporter family protein [Vagococcus allomyrinae]
MTSSKKTKMLVLNGIVAAMYLALSMITPFAQGPIQFRVSESLNHLVVFNKKLMWGVLGGVVLYNMLFSEFGWLDVVFGGGQSFIALGLTAFISKYVTDIKKRMIFNTIFFTISMFMIAIMLHIAIEVPFWLTFGTTALSELVIMSISAPIMYLIGQQIDLT